MTIAKEPVKQEAIDKIVNMLADPDVWHAYETWRRMPEAKTENQARKKEEIFKIYAKLRDIRLNEPIPQIIATEGHPLQ